MPTSRFFTSSSWQHGLVPVHCHTTVDGPQIHFVCTGSQRSGAMVFVVLLPGNVPLQTPIRRGCHNAHVRSIGEVHPDESVRRRTRPIPTDHGSTSNGSIRSPGSRLAGDVLQGDGPVRGVRLNIRLDVPQTEPPHG